MSAEIPEGGGQRLLSEIQSRYRTPDRFGRTCVGRFGYVEGLDNESRQAELEINRVRKQEDKRILHMHTALADAIGVTVEVFREALVEEQREIDGEIFTEQPKPSSALDSKLQ